MPYTQAVLDNIFRLQQQDLTDIQEQMGAYTDAADTKKWMDRFYETIRQFKFSGRYALMRILYCRATGSPLSLPDQPADKPLAFEDTVGGKKWQFENICMARARKGMHADQYISYCLQKASSLDETLTENDLEETIRPLFQRIFDGRKYTRAEAFQAGHLLRFTLKEMQWFLVRTFDTDEGFRFNSSGDLIEAFGFLTGAGATRVQDIKAAYAGLAKSVPAMPAIERPDAFTRSTAENLPRLVEAWQSQTGEQIPEEKFLAWITQQSLWLDCPSQSAYRLYFSLANWCYQRTLDHDFPCWKNPLGNPDGQDPGFVRLCEDRLSVLSAKNQWLPDPDVSNDGRHSIAVSIADTLLKYNNRIGRDLEDLAGKETTIHAEGRETIWDCITVDGNGNEPIRKMIARKLTGEDSRIISLLTGTLPVEKSDFLYLIWFACNLVLFNQEGHRRHQLNTAEVAKDFQHICDLFLGNAQLPPFYPPHLTEQFMLFSIVMEQEEMYTLPALNYFDFLRLTKQNE